MSDLYSRVRYLPTSIAKTEEKLRRLYIEAQDFGMADLMIEPSLVNAAWDRETMLAYLEHLEARGGY